MSNRILYLPEENVVIAHWLGVEPVEEVPADLTLDLALEKLGQTKELHEYTSADAAVAVIALASIQKRLPDWMGEYRRKTSADGVSDHEPADRGVALMPVHLLTINWASSGPGFDWPVSYLATYLPLYEVYVVNSSADSDEMFGVCDLAIGSVAVTEDLREGAGAVIGRDWLKQYEECSQEKWEEIIDAGRITHGQAEAIAGGVWLSEECEDD
ncbi:MAG: hypothetical protein O3A96_06985 [Proteobacteria bacterium]|nr:hypothetical protein [Pseudomonadota bacterium]